MRKNCNQLNLASIYKAFRGSDSFFVSYAFLLGVVTGVPPSRARYRCARNGRTPAPPLALGCYRARSYVVAFFSILITNLLSVQPIQSVHSTNAYPRQTASSSAHPT